MVMMVSAYGCSSQGPCLALHYIVYSATDLGIPLRRPRDHQITTAQNFVGFGVALMALAFL